jgi:hypothetical protein
MPANERDDVKTCQYANNVDTWRVTYMPADERDDVDTCQYNVDT